MESANSYLKLAEVDILSTDNTKSAKSIDVGIATKRELVSLRRDGKITQKEELEFMVHCYDKVKDERIDSLLASLLKGKSHFFKLWQLVQCLIVLSHGQAGVERGFSINSELMQCNFKEKSVIAMRTIYDHIKKCGGVLNVKIDQDLRNAARNASSIYRNELRKQQETERERKRADEQGCQ
ncbi:hypothetical protein AC249_AIPGENE5481 [Exaiptasia diaphana]|nr:hypothetical protein AC249_AIPGENE5481 [Exaiptasia diaphana]